MTAVRLREEYGEYVVAEKCVERIQEAESDRFLIEGIRSPHEVEIFRENFPGFKVISVFSTRKTRFRRLKSVEERMIHQVTVNSLKGMKGNLDRNRECDSDLRLHDSQ